MVTKWNSVPHLKNSRPTLQQIRYLITTLHPPQVNQCSWVQAIAVTLISVNTMATNQSNFLKWTSRRQAFLSSMNYSRISSCSYLCWKLTLTKSYIVLSPTVCTFKPESNWLQQTNFCSSRCLSKARNCHLKSPRDTSTKKYKNYTTLMENKVLQTSSNSHYYWKSQVILHVCWLQ